MRRFGLQIIVACEPCQSRIGQQSLLTQKSRQRHRAHAIGTGQKLTPREWVINRHKGIHWRS